HAEEAPRLEDQPGRAQRLEDVDRGRPGDRHVIAERDAEAGESGHRVERDRKDGSDHADDADLSSQRLKPTRPLRVDRLDGAPAKLTTDHERAEDQREDAAEKADPPQTI